MVERSYITTCNGFYNWVRGIKSNKLALDTETTDLSYCKLDLRGFSLCDGLRACYVNVWDNPEREEILTRFKKEISFQPAFQKLIFHGAPFDLKVLHKTGCERITPDIFCTMTAAHLINENMKKGLKYLAKRYLKVENTLTYEQAARYGFDSPQFIEYATNDAIWTWQLHEIFNRTLYQQKLNKLFYEIEMPFQFVLMDLAINGVLFDLEEINKLSARVSRDIYDMEFKLRDIVGIKYQTQSNLFTEDKEILSGVNMRSPQQLADIIQNRLGLTIDELTDGGKPSVGKVTLLKLKGQHKFIDLLKQYKIATKLSQGFLEPFADFVDIDGRVHAGFHNCVARTGRLSCSKPNLQQSPKEQAEYPVDFRGTIIAPEGKTLLVCDYAGQELRVLTQVSKDKNLINAFNKDKDIHLETTNKSFNLDIPDEQLYTEHPEYEALKKKHKVVRDKTKNCVVFPIIYGTTAYGVSKSLGITEEVAQGYIDDFLNLYPSVREAIRRCGNFLKAYKYVYTLSGRRRRLYDLTPKAYRQAFNFLIQGYSADMTRCAATNVRNLGLSHPEWELKLVLIVHDELVLEIKDEYLEKAKPLVQKAMESAVKMCIPLIVEIGTGKRYSDAK